MENDVVQILVPIFVSLFTAWRIVVGDKKRKENEQTERDKLHHENKVLQTRIAGFEAIVDDLRGQVQTLAAYKELYERLSEAHDRLTAAHNLLTKDYNVLKKRVGDLSDQVDQLSRDLQASRQSEDKLRERVNELLQENATLKTSVLAYKDALGRVGETTEAIEKLIVLLQEKNGKTEKETKEIRG